MRIANFEEMVAAARRLGPVPIAVAAAHDAEVLRAVGQAQAEGMVEATLIGDGPSIEALAAETGVALTGMRIVHELEAAQIAGQAVALAREGKAGVVVKGQLKTSQLLGAVLDRSAGIRGPSLLSHVGIFELPGMERLIYLSDSGVVVDPDLYQKLEIIKGVVRVARLFGVMEPRVAILAASERVHPKIPASVDALALAKMAEQGWVKGAVVDGPVGLEVAVSPRAAALEGSDSPIAGLADILIVPNVEAGNIMAKGLQYFAGARMAGLVVGARVPVIISSRADSAETRYLSLAMAVILAREDGE